MILEQNDENNWKNIYKEDIDVYSYFKPIKKN
jgi:hypothetical protein